MPTTEIDIAVPDTGFPHIAGADLEPIEAYPSWEGEGLPTLQNCDLENPRQTFLWMFTAMPGVVGAPLVLGSDYWELVSYHLVELGARLTEDRIKKYRPSDSSMLNRWTAAGEWVDLSQPDPDPQTLRDLVRAMPQADRMSLKKVVTDEMGLDEDTTPASAPAGHMSVVEMAARLEIGVDTALSVLADFGLEVTAEDWIERSIAERVVLHLGL
ncbi:hypothetical protein RhoFasGS6_03910 [Rhodococcus fascians]|uniref:phage gene 29 protein family protein n=1 Tax=Rhodococcoides fascians TaxID=1828 RepID=UPI001427E144|nr:hypothetical protein [Rhodococcus fascians]